ncbi:MAG: F0F1 ATP synthase subunit B [Armatimonadota bacterium]
MEQILHALNIEPKAILVQIAGFLVLLWLLKRFLFGPVSNMLETRRSEIQSAYDKLEEDQRAMDAQRAELERRLAGIEAEARERIQAALKEAQQMRDDILSKAREDADRIREDARQEAQREYAKAFAALREQIADLAIQGAERVLREALDADRHRRLVAEFIASVPTRAGDSAHDRSMEA